MNPTRLAEPEQRAYSRFVQRGELSLRRVCWGREGAFVEGTVGGFPFDIIVPTADLLNRGRFGFALWRFRSLFAVQPDLTDGQEMIAAAEGGVA